MAPQPDTFPVIEPSAQPSAKSLTSMRWSLWAGAGLVVLAGVLTIAAGGVIGMAASAGIATDALAAITAWVLSAVYITLILVVWLSARAHGEPFSAAVGLGRLPVWQLVGYALAAALLGRLVAAVWGWLITVTGIDLSGVDVDPTSIFPSDAWGIAAMFLIAAVLAPIAEEVVFRGVLLPAVLDRWGARSAVVVSSVVFALVHVMPFSVVPVFVFALMLGWLFVRTRSLWVCIWAHALFNGIGLALLYVAKGAGWL